MNPNTRKTLMIILALILPTFGMAQQMPNDVTGNYYLPAIAEVGKGALLKSELIYELDNRPTQEVHASTLIETPEG